MEEMNKKIKAVILGHAVGDALGVPVEFCDREELITDPVTDMRGYGTYPYPKGCWSDDTSMSLAAFDSLSKGDIDYFEIMINFVKWLENGAYTPTGESFDVGRTCIRSIIGFAEACCLQESDCVLPDDFDATRYGQDGERANGNGSLMRIHPFSLMTWFNKKLRLDFEEIIDKGSALTHAHERSKLACRIYTLILHSLLEMPKKDAVITALNEAKHRYLGNAEYEYFKRLFGSNFKNLGEDQIKSSGYVIDTIEAAIWCLLTTDSYRDCVLKAVNLGDDTDTVGAIAGGLAGALYGYDAIPKEWLDCLKRKEYIEKMCERAYCSWCS